LGHALEEDAQSKGLRGFGGGLRDLGLHGLEAVGDAAAEVVGGLGGDGNRFIHLQLTMFWPGRCRLLSVSVSDRGLRQNRRAWERGRSCL